MNPWRGAPCAEAGAEARKRKRERGGRGMAEADAGPLFPASTDARIVGPLPRPPSGPLPLPRIRFRSRVRASVLPLFRALQGKRGASSVNVALGSNGSSSRLPAGPNAIVFVAPGASGMT